MLFVIMGPPCGGKSSWVNERATPGDIVIDFDRIATALSPVGGPTHGHKRPLAQVAFRARESAISEALKHCESHDVYLIHSVPKAEHLSRYRKHGAQVVTLDPGRDVVTARCEAERGEDSLRGVSRWYASHGRRAEPAPAPTPPMSGGNSRSW